MHVDRHDREMYPWTTAKWCPSKSREIMTVMIDGVATLAGPAAGGKQTKTPCRELGYRVYLVGIGRT